MKYFLILSVFISNCAFAGVYKCKQASGKYAYQSTPCAKGEKTMDVKEIKTQSELPESQENVLTIAKAKQLIKQNLIFDPEKAKFRRMARIRHKDGMVVCGEVDALNLIGQFLGYRKVAVQNGEVVFVRNSRGNGSSGDFSKALDAQYDQETKKYLALGCRL